MSILKHKPTNNPLLAIVFAIAICLICLNSSAEIMDYYDSSELMIVIGEVTSLKVNSPKQVKIGNPSLLDVASAGTTELLLSGLSEGETTLTVVDNFGKKTYTVKIYKEDLVKAKERVDVLLDAAGFRELQTRIGDREKKIFIVGRLPTSKKDSFENRIASVKDSIVNLVDFYDDVPSVEIDVEVLEIGKTELDNLGLEWNKTITFSEGSTGKLKFDNLINPKHTLHILSDWRSGTFTATLNYLKEIDKARTLSRPKLVCLSGKEATLLVGGERPIISGSTTTTAALGGSTTDYEIELKEYGIKLSVKPIVKENNEIQVNLKTEITEIDDTEALALSSTVSTPGFTKRTAETELTVVDGQTVFLAGLIKHKQTDERDSVAGFGSIPILGAIFRHKDFQQRDTEVVITLTPTILRNALAAQSGTEASSQASVSIPSSGAAQVSPSTEIMPSLAAEDPVNKYSTMIQSIIYSNIKYPAELKSQAIEGTVKLSLHLLPTGELLGTVVMQSCGNALLDESAEKSVKRLSPFPAFPPEIKLKELWLDIPIVYRADK